jgi:hypothetical protein
MLIHGMTTQEIRVLQEYRRLTSETLTLAQIKAIKHPAGGGDAPARSLVPKGFLTADPAGESYTLTPQAKEFLAIDYKPETESGGGETEEVEV